SPFNRASLRFPNFTSRFNAVESSDSSFGLNWLTLMRNGRLITTTTRTAKMIPTHFTTRINWLRSLRVYSRTQRAATVRESELHQPTLRTRRIQGQRTEYEQHPDHIELGVFKNQRFAEHREPRNQNAAGE